MNPADQERQRKPTDDEQERDHHFTFPNERSSNRRESPSALSTSRPMASKCPCGALADAAPVWHDANGHQGDSGCHDCKYHRQNQCKTCLVVIDMYRHFQERSK
jgi:hypothetical protein